MVLTFQAVKALRPRLNLFLLPNAEPPPQPNKGGMIVVLVGGGVVGGKNGVIIPVVVLLWSCLARAIPFVCTAKVKAIE